MIVFTLAIYNVAMPLEIPTMIKRGVGDEKLFLIDTNSPNRVATGILPKTQVDEVMTDVLKDFAFGIQEAFEDDEDENASDLLQDAIGSSDLDYRFSTNDAPHHIFGYTQLLTEFNRLRAKSTTSRHTELNIYLWRCNATRIMLKRLELDQNVDDISILYPASESFETNLYYLSPHVQQNGINSKAMTDATFFHPDLFTTVWVKILGHEPPIMATTDHSTTSKDIRSMIDYNYLRSLTPEGASLLENNIVTPTPPCRFVYGTTTAGGERVVGMLSRRLKITMELKEKASSNFLNAKNVEYPPGDRDMKIQNVLVVRNLPVPFHLSLKGVKIVLNFAGGSGMQSSDFPPFYRNHTYWKSGVTTDTMGGAIHNSTQTSEIGSGVTGHASKAYVDCCLCCQKKANYICSRCKSEWYCSRKCQKRDWGRHKLECAIFDFIC